jgi:predicted nucleotidyltransferase
MMKLPKDFKELLNIFNEREVQYMVVGGYAVVYYGYVRATDDINIWINNDDKNVQKVIQGLGEFGFPADELKQVEFEKDNQIIRMGIPPFCIELLTGVSGLSFSETYSDRVTAYIDDIKIHLINLEHLKANKKASGRHKDLDDLENLPDHAP